MGKHFPSYVWHTRITTGPYQTVRTENSGELRIAFMPGEGKAGISVVISRRDARLLAKRINQCLDETK